jgi:hypothetical protein
MQYPYIPNRGKKQIIIIVVTILYKYQGDTYTLSQSGLLSLFCALPGPGKFFNGHSVLDEEWLCFGEVVLDEDVG